ncbi:MAG: LPD28 domain-containing protein [Ruminococcus flavefaciens]
MGWYSNCCACSLCCCSLSISFAYDVRHDDDCNGKIIEVRPYILVNHWGTVICKEPIEMTDIGCKFVEESDYRYTGETCRLFDYI